MSGVLATRSLFFLVGGGTMVAILWWTSRMDDPAAATFASDPGFAPAAAVAGINPAAVVAETDLPAPPSTSAQKLFDATLPILRACEGQERTARALLLISELRRAGPEGIAVLRAFLATQEDLTFGPLFKIDSATVLGPKSLRAAMLHELGGSKDPAARQILREETLNSLRKAETLVDAEQLITNLETWDRGAHRAEAVSAIKRLVLTETGGGLRNNTSSIAKVVALFGASELLPELEAVAIQDPKAGLHELFGALWSLPVELRKESTERILADDSLRSALGTAYSLHKLDFRIPQARELALEWFGSSAAATEKAAAAEYLGSTKGWGLSFPSNPDGSPTVPGSPGTPAQAEARLALLEEVASMCPEPLIQQKLAEARANLVQQTHGSTK